MAKKHLNAQVQGGIIREQFQCLNICFGIQQGSRQAQDCVPGPAAWARSELFAGWMVT
jgi:hypothetical protein